MVLLFVCTAAACAAFVAYILVTPRSTRKYIFPDGKQLVCETTEQGYCGPSLKCDDGYEYHCVSNFKILRDEK